MGNCLNNILGRRNSASNQTGASSPRVDSASSKKQRYVKNKCPVVNVTEPTASLSNARFEAISNDLQFDMVSASESADPSMYNVMDENGHVVSERSPKTVDYETDDQISRATGAIIMTTIDGNNAHNEERGTID